jgi:hypothetical protein
LGHLVEFDLADFDSLFANAHQPLDHVLESPLAIFALAIGLE